MKKIISRGFIAALIAVAASGSSTVRAQTELEGGGCPGRISWLTGVCTYCEWGGRCGGCLLEGGNC